MLSSFGVRARRERERERGELETRIIESDGTRATERERENGREGESVCDSRSPVLEPEQNPQFILNIVRVKPIFSNL